MLWQIFENPLFKYKSPGVAMPRPSAGPSLEGDTWPVPGGLMLSMPESGWGGVPRAGAGGGGGLLHAVHAVILLLVLHLRHLQP